MVFLTLEDMIILNRIYKCIFLLLLGGGDNLHFLQLQPYYQLILWVLFLVDFSFCKM